MEAEREMEKIREAKYRRKNHIHVFDGFVHGEVHRDEFGVSWVDFTTKNGTRFGAVPLEDVEIGE